MLKTTTTTTTTTTTIIIIIIIIIIITHATHVHSPTPHGFTIPSYSYNDFRHWEPRCGI